MRPRRPRRGLSLWEITAVVTILGILSAVVVGRNGRSLLGNYGAQGDARRVGIALLQAKRRAISTGTMHGLVFNSSGGSIVSVSVVSITGGVPTTVDGPTMFTTGLTVTTSHTQMTYDFEGKAAAAYWVQLAGPARTWRIDVVPITGAISTAQL